MPDSSLKETVFGEQIALGDLRDRVGDVSQVAGIREMCFANGPETGTRLIQIRNAAGLCVELLPDRCMDIGQVWLHGIPFAWMGPGGLPSRSSGVSVDEALGGLMTTCGFDHIRAPEIVEGRTYPQHGSMALRPARTLSVGLREENGRFVFIIEAETVHATLMGSEYRLARRLAVPFSENEIRLEDRLTVARGGASFALYHVNLGYPLINGNTKVAVNDEEQSDLPGAISETRVAPAPMTPYLVSVRTSHGYQNLMLDLLVESSDLPWLQTHRRSEPGIGLFCIEPVTHDRKSHVELISESPRPFPQDLSFDLQFRFAVQQDMQ